MDTVVSGANIAGTFLSAAGTLEGGEAQQKAATYQAAQMRRNALQEQAAGIQAANEEARKTELMQSRILAVAGASGAGTLDPTVLNLIGQTAAEGKLASMTRIYNSEVAAQGMREQAAATEYEGALAKRASKYKAYSTMLSGGKSIMDMYGGDKPAKVEVPTQAPTRDYSLSSGGSSVGFKSKGFSLGGAY